MRRSVAKWLFALVALACAGCTPSARTNYPVGEASEPAPVTVALRDLKPTVSMSAQVVASPVFVIPAPTAGEVSGLAAPGATVEAGRTVALVDGRQVVSPVDGVVVGPLVDAGQKAPSNLPLLAVRYAGFALIGAPTTWAASVLHSSDATGRAQISNGPGPLDCVAVVRSVTTSIVQGSPADDTGSSVAGESTWMCLLSKDVTANEGQSGVVVVTGPVAEQVIAVPVSAVAGRQGNGQVTLVSSAGRQVVSVGLGRTDGSYIEITSGVSAGDQISAIAPNLDTKVPR